jgi:hypothetical protein
VGSADRQIEANQFHHHLLQEGWGGLGFKDAHTPAAATRLGVVFCSRCILANAAVFYQIMNICSKLLVKHTDKGIYRPLYGQTAFPKQFTRVVLISLVSI